MSDFTRSGNSCARKKYVCDHCGKGIEIGEKYGYIAGKWDGSFGVFRSHPDCFEAAAEYHELADLYNDEGVCLMNDIEKDDWQWLRGKYPAVAARLGIPLTSS